MHIPRFFWVCGAAAAAVVLGASTGQAQQGSIAVRVVDASTTGPVDQAQVSIIGTTIGGLTNAEGRVLLRGVAPGTHQVRVLRVGYAEQKKSVTVAAAQQATVDFSLGAVAVSLAPVVTTATGETRRVEIGNAVTNISVANVTQVAPVQNVFDALNARAPGVQIVSGTQTGSGARVRIRGQNSLSLSNDPIYVIDGVRMTSNINSSSLFTGGAQPSRVGDINPEEIESIEIVKGPSAATLYGTDAANGVIVITTKRGRAGSARWTVYGEGGLIEDRNTYPTAYTIFGKRIVNGVPQTTNAPLNFCNNTRVATKQCTVDSVAALNVFDEPYLTPLGKGYRAQYGAQLSGGTDAVRYFLSAEREDETGVLELPEFERVRFDTLRIPLREWTERPNVLGRTSVRANLNATVNPQLDVAANSNFINLGQRFSLESNATAGLGSQIFGGPGCNPCSPDRLVGGGLNTPLNGYRAWTPGYTWQEKAGQRLNRFIGSLNANWRPTSWWQNRLTVGNDLTDRVDDNLLFRGEGPPITATYRNGFKENHRTDIRNLTADLGSSATWTPRGWMNFKTTVGAQYIYYTFERGLAGGEDLPPGTQTAGAAATEYSAEASTIQKTLGLFVEEAVALNDRLFLTAAVRSDQNSAFGTDFQRVFYPKGSVSWIVSDEGFFPQIGWLNSLRLRLAGGASGVQPGPNDALRTFASATANIRGVDLPAVVSGALGNPELKPERSTELEGGFEAKLFSDRVNLDVTYYQKKTKDALIDAIVAPSAGSATNVTRNLGSVRNTGWEMLLTTQLLDRDALAIDVSLNTSTNANRLLSLGGTPPQIGTTTRVVEGYPLFGFWAQPITGWQDKNGDGILTYSSDANLNEVFVGDSVVFRGYTTPRHVATLSAGFDLFKRRLRVQTMFDYRGGNLHYNNTERIRCVSRQNCAGLMDPNASLTRKIQNVGGPSVWNSEGASLPVVALNSVSGSTPRSSVAHTGWLFPAR
jgi:TonB-linked SusC/RagA family outer membrane protein